MKKEQPVASTGVSSAHHVITILLSSDCFNSIIESTKTEANSCKEGKQHKKTNEVESIEMVHNGGVCSLASTEFSRFSFSPWKLPLLDISIVPILHRQWRQ